MQRILILLFSFFLILPISEGKDDLNKFLGRLADAGSQVAQKADDLKEAYKAEGRAYARELGDIMMERAMANEKVNQTLDSVRTLCWGVVIYITLVSFLLFGMMLRINALLGKLRKEKEHSASS